MLMTIMGCIDNNDDDDDDDEDDEDDDDDDDDEEDDDQLKLCLAYQKRFGSKKLV